MWLFEFIKSLFKKPVVSDWRDGCLPSPTDYRDIKLSAIQQFRPLPANYLIPYILRISNQGLNPFCVGFSGATLKEEKERREKNFIDFDGEWLYRKCKESDGMPNFQGTYFRMALEIMQKIGVKSLNGSENEASQYKIGSYARVETTFEMLKSAIYQNGAILAGFKGSDAGWKNAYIRSPLTREDVWRHAVVLLGWNEKYIIGQNSWGENWGEKGLFFIPPEYLPFEAWAILTDLPNIPNQLPKPKYYFNNDLSFGMYNNEVKILQQCLQFEGIFPPEQECTGYFGSITLAAVKAFQQRYGIIITGYVGRMTRTKLNKIFS